jgi:hypothetical protein
MLIGAVHAHAFEMKIEPDISISENYTSTQNLYLIGLRSWFNTRQEQDLISIALEQTIAGSVFGDVILLGNSLQLTGEYFDDVRIMGNKVYISGVVNKDLVILARDVVIAEDAIINGDSLILANSILIQGQIVGATQMTSNILNVSGILLGKTTLTGQKIIFSKNANIITDVAYFSPQRAIIEDGAQIKNRLNFNQIQSITQTDIVKRIFFTLVSFWAIIKLVATLFLIFILTQLFRVFTQRTVDIVLEKRFKILLYGGISLIKIPVLILILIASIVLIPVALILGFIFGIMIILLPAISAIIIAALYQKFVLKIEKVYVDFKMSALALVFITFFGFVPIVGSWIVYLLYLAAFGALVLCLYEQVRRNNKTFKNRF